uniref:Uncharacterized protein n=1 Tax=Arundo donax TaxID=35708 RepID=A0A0A8Z9U6_ARUDO
MILPLPNSKDSPLPRPARSKQHIPHIEK